MSKTMETRIKERRSRFFHHFGLGMTVTKTLFKKSCGMPGINLGVGAGCNTQIYRQLQINQPPCSSEYGLIKI